MTFRRALHALAVILAAVALSTPCSASGEPFQAGPVAPPVAVQWPAPAPRLDQGSRDTCLDFAVMQQLNMLPGRKITQPVADRISDRAQAAVVSVIYSADDSLRDALAYYGYRTRVTHLHGVDAALASVRAQPVALSLPFFSGMYSTTPDGHWRATGTLMGVDHGVVLSGYNPRTGRVLMVNQWGRDWGIDGRMWMTVSELRSLFDAYPANTSADAWTRA